MNDPNPSSTYGAPHYTSNPTHNTHSSPGTGIGTRIRGAIRVVHGFGETLRGSAMGLLDKSLDSSGVSKNDEISRKGSLEMQRGMAELKGKPYTAPAAATTTTTAAPPTIENSAAFGGGTGGVDTTVQQPAAPVTGYGAEKQGGYNAPTTTGINTAAAPNSVQNTTYGYGSTGSTVRQQQAVPPVSNYGTEYKGAAAAPSTSAGGTY